MKCNLITIQSPLSIANQASLFPLAARAYPSLPHTAGVPVFNLVSSLAHHCRALDLLQPAPVSATSSLGTKSAEG